ncbi:TonB-dependent receptor [Aquimarina sp. U1-2]|uniref:TonB-dependent receptor n=1 Tax=Aquimarina sp. U1-2 TaxID=2823141 RepID=UPI001AECE8FD|nr:TonB-dependent receptor [Aquimarina sp. U1-2]MBP2833675.1 TonB-dependent receptor [Aquimarina sp. U1-2]
MKKKITSIFLFLLICGISFAQDTKVVTGTVIDPEANYPLFGATVVLLDGSGSTLTGVVTNEFGEFTIRTKASGNAKIEVSYIGFATRSFGIELSGSQVDVGNVLMNKNAAELDQVVVIGNVEGKSKALNLQRTADNIKNVVSADLIGRFPDLNVAEALQRVPGVNIQRDKGEGSTISIRGTPLNFTTVQINGEQIPSVQQNGARTESLDLIPVDQLASMEITKVPTPDMDGDAVGGTVNLRTPIARRFNLGVKAESGIGYNDISDGLNALNKLRLDKRFFKTDIVPNGKLGIILGGSMYSSNNSEHRNDARWGGLPITTDVSQEEVIVMDQYEYRLTENERERYGITGTLDYKFDENNSLVFNYMYNRREDTDVRNRFRFDMDTDRGARYQTLDSITGSGARARRDINVFNELKENQTFNLEGSHTLGSWDIDWGAFYTFSERDFTSDRADFGAEDVTIIADNPLGIYGEEPNFRLSTNDPSVYNPFIYDEVRRYEEDIEKTEADNLVGKLNITKNILLGQDQLTIKFGGKYRTQTNQKFRDNRIFVINDPNDVVREEEFFLRSLSGVEPTNYLYGDYRFGPLIGQTEFMNVIDNNRRFLDGDRLDWNSRQISFNDTYEAQEDIYAAYAMGKIKFNKLMILAGLRYERNEVSYDAFDVVRVGNTSEATPISGGNDFDFFLPNVHVKYNITDYTSLRLSTVFNYARPDFVDLVPFVDFDVDANRLILGNSELTPAEALNIDLMFEHYFQDVGVFSIGGFYKKIDDFQFDRIDNSLTEDAPGFPGTVGFEFRQKQNGETATVAGIEFNFFRTLGFLPGILKNFNVEGNYTYAYSDSDTQFRTGVPLQGQAEHTFNAALAFNYKAFSARVSANYNGEFLTGLASTEDNDLIQKDRLQIDANASIMLGKRLRFYVEGINLNNEPTIRYQGNTSRISRRAFFGWSTRAGVSYTL